MGLVTMSSLRFSGAATLATAVLLAPAAAVRSPSWQEKSSIEANVTSGRQRKTFEDIGVLSGLRLESDFERADFWGRKCEQYTVTHHDDDDSQVYLAEYNECNGVSDVVYYTIDGSQFAKAAGRGGGWKDDFLLKEMFKEKGKKSDAFASASDYGGCGFFNIDRGHQAPVASFNLDHDVASLTNLPTNLSPQSSILNQNIWKFVEIDMRQKALYVDESAENTFELITGPLYELPRAFFTNTQGKERWRELLQDGGVANTKTPWCTHRSGDPWQGDFESPMVKGRKKGTEGVTCTYKPTPEEEEAETVYEEPSENPNSFVIEYARSEKHFSIRAPLGYFKLMLIKSGGNVGRRTCAYIMDQVGQCMLVSLELLAKVAHLDFSKTALAEKGGLEVQDPDSDAEYNAYVNPYFCLPSTVRKNSYCQIANTLTDPAEITNKLMNTYWWRRNQ